MRTIYHRALIFYMLIGLDGDMTPIDIELKRSKVKVRRMLIGLGEDMTPIYGVHLVIG